jgi:hypothetical protein
MKRVIIALTLACGVSPVAADKIDPRLATVRKAYIVAVDPLTDDQTVAACVIDRIHTLTPLESVTTKDEADVVLKLSSHIPGAGKRFALGMMGGTPSANMAAELPDGTPLWSDGAKNRKGTGGAIGASRSGSGLACGLANGLLETLRDAMQKARDAKK